MHIETFACRKQEKALMPLHSGETGSGTMNTLTFLYTGLGCWGGHLSAGKFQNKAYYTFSELCRTDHHNNHHPRRQQKTRETSAFACLGIKVGGGFSSTPLCLKTSAWLTACIQYVWLQGTDHHRGFPWWPPSCVHSSNTLLASFTWDGDVPLEGLSCRAREKRWTLQSKDCIPCAQLFPLWWDHIVRTVQVIMRSTARIKEQPQALWWGDSKKDCVKSTICRPQRCLGEGHVGVCR